MSGKNLSSSRPRVGVTGASGTVGKALLQQLTGRFDLQPMSRSIDGTNLMDPADLVEKFQGLAAVVHLAWQYADSQAPDTPTTPGGLGYFDNLMMTRHVLEAAATAGVGRVLLASSVHADYHYDWVGPHLKKVDDEPRGSGPYGCAKVMVEKLACEFASPQMHVACIRYGALTADNQPHPSDDWERRVWLSHHDAGQLITAALTQDWPEPFAICYAVSDNEGRVHDLHNPWVWTPRDAAPRLG